MSGRIGSSVTIAIPLYRSSRFVDNILANLRRVRWPNVEILISDRHLDDDALDRLSTHLEGDPRVRFVRRPDRADWVTHYNDLVAEATGDYFCWMPHDDIYDEGYIEALAAALDRRTEAILAFGVMEATGVDMLPPVGAFTPPPFLERDRWTLSVALRLLLGWDLFCVVRGLVRRGPVVGRRLWLPRTHDTVRADVCWAFTLALDAPFVFVPRARCVKRYYAESASAGWRYGVCAALDEGRVLCRALWRSPQPRFAAVGAGALLVVVAVLRAARRSMRVT